ncbi:hypothetical protein ASPCAL08475 [Aspergillus calidoustus]|uniref:Uncharacterized protein n=1 Tax=Aspergillus calidoustus TaxID=454130 RepID=A0A0U5GWX6_ASPCI|nr:hypothetical protein ASPCAL08475 [Aspergillus calidoustus]
MPSSTQKPEVGLGRTSVPPRPKAAVHRGNQLMASLQSELANLPESLASDSSLYELVDSRWVYATSISVSISTSASSSPSNTSFTNSSANTSATSISSTTTVSISISTSTHHLSLVITGCIHAGMSACEIGQYLHRVTRANATDCSATASTSTTPNPTPVSSAEARSGTQAQPGVGLVSRMIALNKPYATIATRVMRVLDLRSSDGYPLYAYVDPGDVGLVPRPGEPTRNDDSESEEDGGENRQGSESPGPKRVWHWGPGQGLLRWPLPDMSKEEIEGLVEVRDDEAERAKTERMEGEEHGKTVHLPRLGCVSHYTVIIVYPSSSLPRSIRVEFEEVGDESGSK